mmetsp:Transcript_7661/g.19019  ORF Transcript_7661/g.19019 Transcript_7661/m.19019 type:complete len:201 (-) Transcript_7661:496-1098(-)
MTLQCQEPVRSCKQNHHLLFPSCPRDPGPCKVDPRSRTCIAQHHNSPHNKCHVHQSTTSFDPRYLVPPWQDGKPSSCIRIYTHRQTLCSSVQHTLNTAYHFHSRNQAWSYTRSWRHKTSSSDHRPFRDSNRIQFSWLGCLDRYQQSDQTGNSKSRRDMSSVDVRLFVSRKLCRRRSRHYLLNIDCNRKPPPFLRCYHPLR